LLFADENVGLEISNGLATEMIETISRKPYPYLVVEIATANLSLTRGIENNCR
jgi:hypothetical protein